MSRKRYLSTNISVDPRVRDLAEHNGEFAALLYTWMIPHADDEGLISANVDELMLQVIPGFRWRTPAEVDTAVAAMVELGLVERVDGQHLRFPLRPFYKYQAYIGPSRRAAPEPEPTQPPNGTGATPASAQMSANQRNAPESAQISAPRARAPSSSSSSSSFSGSHSELPPAPSGHPPRLHVVGESVPKPTHKPINDEYLSELAAEFGPRLGGEVHVRLVIDHALNHRQFTRAIDKRRYLRNWLCRDVEYAQSRIAAGGGRAYRKPLTDQQLEDLPF